MALFPRVYDAVMGVAERGRVGRLRRAMVSRARGRVLEIGAGTGLDFPHYPPGTWVVASDPDLDMLRRARPRARAARGDVLLVAADAECLPFRDGAFDEAIVGLAMCTIPHPERALAELRRTLKPSAALRLLEHVRLEQPLVGRLQDWLTPVWRRVAGADVDSTAGRPPQWRPAASPWTPWNRISAATSRSSPRGGRRTGDVERRYIRLSDDAAIRAAGEGVPSAFTMNRAT